METLNAIWALGYSFIEEKGVSMLRVEPVMWFFNPEYCVYECEEVFDYTETTAKDLLLNEFETGYEKYADNDLHTLLEFNTYRQYLLPFKHFKGKVTKKAKFITSGYMIEILRRIQFADKPKDSDSNDDSIFLFTMSDVNPLECERGEAFSFVFGEDDISSIYNARISPARMVLSWMPFLSSVCYHKSVEEQVKCQFYKQNGEFATQLKTESFLIVENQNFTVSRNKKFIPAIAEFKTPMFAKDYLRIRDSLLSRLGDEENNGYIQFFDRTGTVKTGWVMEMEYDAYRELASLTLLLRNADNVEQPTYDDENTPQPDAEYVWKLDFSELEEVKQLNKADYGEEFTVSGWSPNDPSELPQPTPPPSFSDYKNGITKGNALYTVTFTGVSTGKVALNTINVWWKASRVNN
ncbi:MAG: hypothetical protein LBJ60_06275 [Tannerellaceae bacterium]|nr:hypothetical protein [Tannerellaceae bacterium]